MTILRRMFVLAAIYAIALQSVLAGPSFLTQVSLDPTVAIICHSDQRDAVPGKPNHGGHDHCALCVTPLAANTPVITPLAAPIARPSDVAAPDEPAASIPRQTLPQLARAPPRLA